MDSDFVPWGYETCRCGNFILKGQKMCEECAAEVGRKVDEALVVDVGGKAVRVAHSQRKKRKPKKRDRYERTMIDRARDRARTRAWIRLAHIYEPMFVALYTEEQLREGLDPVPIPPMHSDPFDVIARDIQEFRERVEATFAAEEPTIPDERPA